MAETILIVEDDPVQRRMVANLLTKKMGYEVIMAAHGKEAIAHFEKSNVGEISAVLMDIEMPEMDGFETLKMIRMYRPDLPVVMLTGSDDTDVAVKAIKAGASDFIVKPPQPAQLDIALKNSIRLSALSRELSKIKRDKEGALTFSHLIGHGSGLAAAVAYGRKAAASDVPVLITGAAGVGKEIFARAIHGESKHYNAAFVGVNCSAMSASQLEAALFSPEKGAFRKAEGGTVFLDDISELPAEVQVRLLRVMQYKELEPVGHGKPVKIHVRLITASEKDLQREVQSGRFREDLYFRLNILSIALQPLRSRQQDIVPLAEYFIERISSAEGLAAKTLEPEAMQYLTAQAWPGNVRELENIIHRALVLCDGDTISKGLLVQIHDAIAIPDFVERRGTPALHINMRRADGHFKSLEDIETEAMQLALRHFDQNIAQAAEALSIAKSTFYRKIKE